MTKIIEVKGVDCPYNYVGIDASTIVVFSNDVPTIKQGASINWYAYPNDEEDLEIECDGFFREAILEMRQEIFSMSENSSPMIFKLVT